MQANTGVRPAWSAGGSAAWNENWLRFAVTLVAPVLVALPPVLLLRRFGPDWVAALAPVPQGGSYLAVGVVELLTTGIAVVALWLFFQMSRWGSLAGLGLQRRYFWGFAAGLLLALAAVGVVFAAVGWSGLMRAHGPRSLSLGAILLAVGTAARAAFVEELACRGLILQGVERLWNRTAGILISTVWFVLPHLGSTVFPMTGARWVGLAAAGLFDAAVFYKGGRNLWLPIGLHLGFDLWFFLAVGVTGRTPGLLAWSAPRFDLNWTFIPIYALMALVVWGVPWLWRATRVKVQGRRLA